MIYGVRSATLFGISDVSQWTEYSTAQTLRKLKIGIIDDDRLIRELLKSQLQDIEDLDYEVEIRAFPDGEEFFNDPWHRQNERFVLIIMKS